MEKNESPLRRILIWSYDRGTIQYDIICALILAFIFLVPKSCFVNRRSDTFPSAGVRQAPSEEQITGVPYDPARSR
jgi:hypothetical protein